MIIRLATYDEIPAILTVMDAARGIMRASGNMNQWIGGYPSADVIKRDIDNAAGYVICDKSILGYFAYIPSPEPTYAKIYGGQWLDDTLPYHVVHRIGSFPDAHGIFGAMLDFCSARECNIRIDTHRDNLIMQHLLSKHGFTYCGIIYLESGDERLAYQRITLKT